VLSACNDPVPHGAEIEHSVRDRVQEWLSSLRVFGHIAFPRSIVRLNIKMRSWLEVIVGMNDHLMGDAQVA
jgi:hypothetical protein